VHLGQTTTDANYFSQSSRSAELQSSREVDMPARRYYRSSNQRLRRQTVLNERDIDYNTQVVIIQPLDTGSKSHPFPHALVAGIERYPSSVTRRMSKTRQQKRSKVKPFIKTINYNHLMPTRYTLELEGLKGVLTNDTFKEVSQREDAKKTVKKALEERYQSGKNRWFFTPLRESSPLHTRTHSYRYFVVWL
jgi:large subunit ribosomal protein L27e